jgi:hypothetical protein
MMKCLTSSDDGNMATFRSVLRYLYSFLNSNEWSHGIGPLFQTPLVIEFIRQRMVWLDFVVAWSDEFPHDPVQV